MARMHDGYGYHLTRKGYPRFNNCGPMRGQYIHRYEAAKKLGRPLRKDEQVHHLDLNKENFDQSNLLITGEREHGWVSAKQAFYMKMLDIRSEQEFYAYLAAYEFDGGNVGCVA